MIKRIADPEIPAELRAEIEHFWPPEEWDNAASISWLESKWNPFAINDTRKYGPCGTPIGTVAGVPVTAEYSISYFQINACNYPSWPAEAFFNCHHNCGTAHMLWEQSGWDPWYFSARQLGLL